MGSTVKASGLAEPELLTSAERVFDRMADDAEWPEQLANQVHSAGCSSC